VLVPDRLQELWKEVDEGRRSREDAEREQQKLLGEYRTRWEGALLERGKTDLRDSLLGEIADYVGGDVQDVDRLCSSAVPALREEWLRTVDPGRRASVEGFYESRTTIHELMQWHSLRDDDGPLAYVLGLEIARSRGVTRCLDFGSGVGSGALLFASAGIDVTLADVSTTLLDFCRWRFQRRARPATFVDLKRSSLPPASFDLVLAMDVFEHLVDPVDAAERLWAALRPGGVLLARIHAEDDAERPHHIVRDFGPTFARMEALGFAETWRDGWLWGHQLFEKPSSQPKPR
jgi:hypothetical protein